MNKLKLLKLSASLTEEDEENNEIETLRQQLPSLRIVVDDEDFLGFVDLESLP